MFKFIKIALSKTSTFEILMGFIFFSWKSNRALVSEEFKRIRFFQKPAFIFIGWPFFPWKWGMMISLSIFIILFNSIGFKIGISIGFKIIVFDNLISFSTDWSVEKVPNSGCLLRTNFIFKFWNSSKNVEYKGCVRESSRRHKLDKL